MFDCSKALGGSGFNMSHATMKEERWQVTYVTVYPG